jgi:L-malate glycosyltransferase
MAAHVLALTDSPAGWQGYSARAREHVLAHFALGPAIDRYEALYRRLATSCPSTP